jgi:hypothetical protein
MIRRLWIDQRDGIDEIKRQSVVERKVILQFDVESQFRAIGLAIAGSNDLNNIAFY